MLKRNAWDATILPTKYRRSAEKGDSVAEITARISARGDSRQGGSHSGCTIDYSRYRLVEISCRLETSRNDYTTHLADSRLFALIKGKNVSNSPCENSEHCYEPSWRAARSFVEIVTIHPSSARPVTLAASWPVLREALWHDEIISETEGWHQWWKGGRKSGTTREREKFPHPSRGTPRATSRTGNSLVRFSFGREQIHLNIFVHGYI